MSDDIFAAVIGTIVGCGIALNLLIWLPPPQSLFAIFAAAAFLAVAAVALPFEHKDQP